MILFLLLHVWLAAELTHKVGWVGLQVGLLLGMAIFSFRLIPIELVSLVDILYRPASELVTIPLQTRKYFFKRIIIRDIGIRVQLRHEIKGTFIIISL